MSYHFHDDRALYFEHQTRTTEEFIIPFIERTKAVTSDLEVLEIGCGEAGVLKAFTKLGCNCTGVELSENKTALAQEFMAEELTAGQLQLINKNIYDDGFRDTFRGRFDLIILKDVIEHIPHQQKLMEYLHTFLRPEGVIFISFPPWWMPFGGHQQMCKSKLKKVPWFHLLPMFAYKSILKGFGEPPSVSDGLIANKQTGITIERFERILRRTGYKRLDRIFYLFNPIYKYKFNLQPRVQNPLLQRLPYLRDFFTTAMYYLLTR